MKVKCFCLFVCIITFLFPAAYGHNFQENGKVDTATIVKLNKQAYNNRLTDPDQTIVQAKHTFVLSAQIGYDNGMGEACRVMGIGYGYISQPDTALSYYLKAITYFKKNNNQDGEAKVDNNIGNLYKESDYEKSIEYFTEALTIANKVKDEDLIATLYINFGNIYYRKKNFTKALDYYNQSDALFTKLGNVANMIQCLQNKGVVYYNLNRLDTAEVLLLKANKQAKEKDLNTIVASINLTLSSLFVLKNDFTNAKLYLNEGLTYAQQVKSPKLEYDYKLTKYELESKQNDYKAALFTLREIYKLDSIKFKNAESIKLNLMNQQFNQMESDRKADALASEQKNQKFLFWASVFAAGFLFVIIILLVSNVNRKTKTNKRLTELNSKISEQKENLNQINHHLEEIIDERTKDLQVKNKKLADYSLHLSHQIRGPIATLKGLLNLERDKLIEQNECIKLMNKCVSEIDDNIIDMSGMLHETNVKV